jgi:hypothetical protein
MDHPIDLLYYGKANCEVQTARADTNRRLVRLTCEIAHVAFFSTISDGSG